MGHKFISRQRLTCADAKISADTITNTFGYFREGAKEKMCRKLLAAEGTSDAANDAIR